MDVSKVANDLKVEEKKVLYWRRILQKHDLIDPRIVGSNKHDYSEMDLEMFRTLKKFLDRGAQTATEAARLIAQKASPEELQRRLASANREIEILQRKVVQLRRPFFQRVKQWVSNVWTALLNREARA